ncbi:glycosyltransferase family 2 protein [Vibrio scophthalmi]|uniref:Putative teichuronic acid biosynthesis glycosyltransferase TuaG n=1 Tax=Vibrio scophthalmi TaxID=45658 RepID=A0A1C7FD63_9VIBR|nr:glycosyltransferase family 2 protein [Vibrio scophthalmi]ANU37678.1 Putative teichuronic acid biosynthesis glycosyltransferase TuaG [Vibrio scophthalmi]
MITTSLSVITPTYNCGEYITRSYRNICQQTYKNWEWIIVNDGSTDDTCSLINQIAKRDDRVKVHHFTANKGRGAARQAAINMSNTNMIVVWDVDDLYDSNRLSLIFNSLIVNKFDFFCSYALVVTNDFKIKGGRHFYHDVINSPSFVHPTLAFNKANILMESYYDDKMKAGEDYGLMMKLDDEYNGEYCNEYLMLYFEDREVNIGKTISAHQSHYRSFKLYLNNSNLPQSKKYFQLLKMKIKGIILKSLFLFPKLYLKTVKFRNSELVDIGKIGTSLLNLAYDKENKILK